MAVQLLTNAAGGVTSPESEIRPARSNFYPINVTLSGSSAGDTVDIFVSPSLQSTTDWHLIFTLTVPAPGGFTDHSYNHIDYPWERIRAKSAAGNAGLVDCFFIPGA